MKLSVVAVTLKIPLNCEVRSTLPAKVKRKINENFTGENNGPGALFLLTSSVRCVGVSISEQEDIQRFTVG